MRSSHCCSVIFSQPRAMRSRGIVSLRCAFATGQRAPKVLQTTTLTSQPTLPPDLWPIGYRSPGGVPKWEIIGDHWTPFPSKFWSSTTERVRNRSTAWNYCAGHGANFPRQTANRQIPLTDPKPCRLGFSSLILRPCTKSI